VDVGRTISSGGLWEEREEEAEDLVAIRKGESSVQDAFHGV